MKYIIDIPEDAEYGILTCKVDRGYCTKDIDFEETEQLTADYINEHYGNLQDEAYQRGLDDAWEAASNISILEKNGGLSCKEMRNIFGTDSPSEIFMRHTAAEAINKIKVYEEKQKAEDKIKVMDEVVWTEDENVVIVVTSIYMTDNMEWCDGFGKDGKVYSILTKNARKTGRHFDIQSILEEMRHD